MMLHEHGPGIIVNVKLLSCKKNSSLLDVSFHMSVNQNDNHHGVFGQTGLSSVDPDGMVQNVASH